MAKGKKTGGRAKGTPNRQTRELRERISEFLDTTFDEIVLTFNQLSPKDKIKYYLDIIQYSLPKLQSIEQNIEMEQNVSIANLTKEEIKEISDKLEQI